ncbi:alpha-L-arabinofuranosidase C-terminal domain-containing protein [Paenibacillus monticola]|uniref:non-reducing end alpha-L-arabinofuranosidase n=1 Tax=Paenibacillus monticola TaxID=2666075 RepID=A0A7X2L1H5_9BACL|nr:alpha-L-arabinofuranosidase C-terminal domain-containing protein [Paenibacillus monticola]MRN53827.1 alpha-L-arabinofuranosidase [Paenibacillus monticola]
MSVKGKLTINTDKQGSAMGDLFGIFFEDLNHAADGGLYAELVQNRSFDFDPIDHPDYHALMAWEKVERGGGECNIRIECESPLNKKGNYAVIDIRTAGDGVGLMNQGFNTGIPVKEGNSYIFSVYARRDSSFDIPVNITLEGIDGSVYAETAIVVTSNEWTKYEACLSASATNYSGRLVLTTKGSGLFCLDMVSLFPSQTFLNRPNGLRKDIATLLADLKPKFMRFPGGCLIHDGSLNADDRDSMYRWKNTIGAVAERPARRNNWRYNQTLGLGYYEYFLFCEDIGAKPIPVLPAGYDPHHKRSVPLNELQPWIDDALDLIEFANGEASSPWGALRVQLGHPEPFNMEYIGIGNEEVGEPFFERYAYFHRAIKAKYPDIQIINSSGPFASGEEYERGWRSARENRSDFVDEHYYQSPEWMLAHHRRYDSFKAEDPKVFIGEYASWGNTYYNALAEAAYMTGFERNAHAVGLACYAPLLCNVDYVNWKPDLIWFNNHNVFGTANYYVQKLFMHHQGNYVLPVQAEGFGQQALSVNKPISGRLAVGTEGGIVEYSRIQLIDHVTGETKEFGDGKILLSDTAEDRENGQARTIEELASIESEHYTLSITAKQITWGRGIMVHFGKVDDRNELLLRIGGWQNGDLVINSIVNGTGSVLTHCLFDVIDEVCYHILLEITGRRIQAYVDGVLVADTEDLLPVLEPLYYSSSIEEATGDVILKIVNLQDTQVNTGIMLEGFDEKQKLMIEVSELSGHSLEAENSFEEPTRIAPKIATLHLQGNEFEYEVPKHSFTVMRAKQLK